jgi:hypothetical protein
MIEDIHTELFARDGFAIIIRKGDNLIYGDNMATEYGAM